MGDDRSRPDNAHSPDAESRGLLAEMDRAAQKASLAQNEVEFFENELALVKTLLEVAETRYSMGHTEEARRAKQEALTGIRTVRRFGFIRYQHRKSRMVTANAPGNWRAPCNIGRHRAGPRFIRTARVEIIKDLSTTPLLKARSNLSWLFCK